MVKKISNNPHEFTRACGDLFLMHDTPVVHRQIGKSTACHLMGLDGKFLKATDLHISVAAGDYAFAYDLIKTCFKNHSKRPSSSQAQQG